MDDAISRWLAEHADELHRDMLGLVSIPSVSMDREGARRALAAFLSLAGDFGLETRLEAGGDVGIAEYGPGLDPDAETLGILAHVDVVDPGEGASWTRAPWGEIADGAVWGRGTQDDKGPLVICLHALKALIALGIPFRKRLRFVVGTMEEIDWVDMRAWRAEGRVPDYGFTPDGEFPVINREKGYCDAWLSFDKADASSLGGFRILALEAGSSINSVPDSARVVLGGPNARSAAESWIGTLEEDDRRFVTLAAGPDDLVEIRARGVAAHSSQPERGDNALVRICVALSRIGENGLVEFISSFSGADLASPPGLRTPQETACGENMGPTTASIDIARTEPGAFVIGINLRTAWGQGVEELDAAFAAAAPRFGFSHRLEQFMPAIYISRDRPFMRAMLAAYERRTGVAGEFVLAPGSSYAKALPRVAAFGPILPGMPDLCHQADECMTFGEIARCAEIYADAIGTIVASPGSFG